MSTRAVPSARVAVVVGATGGIGRAVASSLASDHAVWLVGRDPVALAELAADLPASRVWLLDLSAAEADWPALPDQLASVDVLVHAAGRFDYGSAAKLSQRAWQDAFEVNLFGIAHVTQLLLAALERARGRVVFINSTAVTGSAALRSVYAASKHALRAYAEALHAEELEHGVRVTSVYLGRVATDMQRAVRREEGGTYEPHRYLSAGSAAAAVRWIVDAPDDMHVSELVIRPRWI